MRELSHYEIMYFFLVANKFLIAFRRMSVTKLLPSFYVRTSLHSVSICRSGEQLNERFARQDLQRNCQTNVTQLNIGLLFS
jgi:hypothetical protein